MWHRTKTEALRSAGKLVQREVDPELLIKRAKEMGIVLPLVTQMVSAPSLGGTALGFQVPYDRLGEFREAVDRVIAAGSKRAA